METKRVVQTAFFVFLIFVPSLFVIPSFSYTTSIDDVAVAGTKEEEIPEDLVRPIIYRVERIDKDLNGIQDSLEAVISRMITDSGAVLRVIVTLYNPVSSQDLDWFMMLGGHVTHVYRYVTYGFAGVIPAANISTFVSLEEGNLCAVERDVPVGYHLDVSVPLIRARPTVWETYGYRGSPNHSIAVIDTGIDDSHPDIGPYGDLNFSRKIVGWYDATSDNASTPEDYGEHGTHVSGIAAGTGAANGLQGSGTTQTTFTYLFPPAGYGYIDYIDIMNPGVIQLSLQWSGSNIALLRLYNPFGSTVTQKIGGSPPLNIQYNTEGTSCPTGRYSVLVANYIGSSGSPFSCLETCPYKGRNDSYNLFGGVASDSKLVGVKVFNNVGSGTLSTLVEAMDWIIENHEAYHIVVASMSLSLEDGATDTTLDQKADTLVRNGIVTTVSAGNDYPDYTIGSPGTAAYVITVAATNDVNGITQYSGNGDPLKNEYGLVKPDVAAPGGTFNPAYGNKIVSADSNDVDALYSAFPDQNLDDYQQMGGTSMAAPHVAGLAALIIQALGNWNWTEEEALKVKMLTSMTAFETQSGEGTNVPSLDRGEKDNKEGYGLVSADAAIEAVTMTYDIGETANETFGLNPHDKKVWARQVGLSAGNDYRFHLSVPSTADYDLYLYDSDPDDYGQPIILKKSVDGSTGADESVYYTAANSNTYYILVKWVSGSGTCNLTSTTEHDVAIASVTPSTTWVYKGQLINITVVAENEGTCNETFNVTLKYENATAGINGSIGTQAVTNLAPDANITLTFDWDTTDVTPCFNYTIKAEASVVPGETEIGDNTFIDGEVEVRLLGDVDGNGMVDIWDLSIAAMSYGYFEWQPEYNPDADLNKDGVVDMQDLTIIVLNYGNTC